MGEGYTGNFDKFCVDNGTIHETTSPYSPQTNDITERKKNKTLKDMIISMLNSFELPFNLWKETLLTATYNFNRIANNKNNKSSMKC